MAKAETEFEAFLKEHLADLGSIRIRRMFGGAGVFAHDVMFGLIADDRLYLKTDEAFRNTLETEGSEPFTYVRPSDGKAFDMGYLSMPESAMDDADEACDWARQALDVALKANAAKPKQKKKPK